VGVEKQKVATAVLFSTPGLPMLFQGEEYAEDAPWDYFTSHTDKELAEAVREGRHQEYLHLQEEGADVSSWADPQDEQTFQRTKLRWGTIEEPPHKDVLAFYRSLIALRKRLAPLRNARKDLTHAEADEGNKVVTIRRDDPSGAAAFTAANFGDRAAEVRLPAEGRWRLAVATSPQAESAEPLAGGRTLSLPGASALIYERVV
jgi:maltooligosyltrehalose trehalohydrolase